MITLEEARAGILRRVVYTPNRGAPELGEITSVSRTMVFVRYDGDRGSKATEPRSLTWLDEMFPSALPPPEQEPVPDEAVMVWMPRQLLVDAQRFAGAGGWTLSALVRLALRSFMDSP